MQSLVLHGCGLVLSTCGRHEVQVRRYGRVVGSGKCVPSISIFTKKRGSLPACLLAFDICSLVL